MSSSVGRRFWAVVDWPFKLAAYGLIQTYRYTLSAFAGRSCRHAPSCSEFTRDAIWRFGFWPGGWMGLARITRCRPGGTHGYDPVPETLPATARWYLPWRYGRWKGMPSERNERRRTDTASRLVQAEPQQVWAALTDPAAVAAWLPPGGMSARIERWDFHPGGQYRMVLTYRNPSAASPKSTKSTDVVAGHFAELVPNRSMVQEVIFESDDPAFAGTMRMHWLLTPESDGTRVTILAENVPDGISAEDHAEGLAASLSNLAGYLAA